MAIRDTQHNQSSSELRRQIAQAARLGYPYYVYSLADAAGVFYVGKGTRNRLFQHGKDGRDMNVAKLARISSCGNAGPTRTVVAFFQTEDAAFSCEAERIAEAKDILTNIAPGAGVRMTPRQRAAFRSWSMLQRIVPRDRYQPPAWIDKETALMVYDLIVEKLRSNALNPCPTSFHFDRAGQLVGCGYSGAEP